MGATAVQPLVAAQSTRVSQKTGLTALSLAVSDALAVVIATAITRAAFQLLHAPSGELLRELLPGSFALLTFALFGLYTAVQLNPASEFRQVIVGSAMGYALGSGFMPQWQAAPLASLGRCATACVASIVLVIACRSLCCAAFSRRSWWGTPAVLFGSGAEARNVFRTLDRHPTGLKIVAIFSRSHIDWPELDHRRVHVSRPEYAADFACEHGVRCAIVAEPSLTGWEVDKRLKEHSASFKQVLVLPGLSGIASVRVEPRAVGGMLALHVNPSLLQHGPQLVKRASDVLLAPILTVALLPVFIFIYLAVKLTSAGPVFYGHTRMGRGTSSFKAWKFRTMRKDADQILSECLANDPELRREWEENQKLKNDPRVTCVGRLLRKTSLDEIPQLWNVLAGDMSFVGPRPIVRGEIARYGPTFSRYSVVRPGITGLWQVSGRNNTTYEERVQMDEHYVTNWSVWFDLYILCRTIKTVLLGEGAY
jgi:Undecaprenyl-phosphate galactose phosphotransferase WbaP